MIASPCDLEVRYSRKRGTEWRAVEAATSSPMLGCAGLLHIIYGVFKSGRPFDETLYPVPC